MTQGNERPVDHVSPELAAELREAGLAWEPRVGDWVQASTGQQPRQVIYWYAATKLYPAGVALWIDVNDNVGEFDVDSCTWLPSVGQMLNELARRRQCITLFGNFLPDEPPVCLWQVQSHDELLMISHVVANAVGLALLSVLRAERAAQAKEQASK